MLHCRLWPAARTFPTASRNTWAELLRSLKSSLCVSGRPTARQHRDERHKAVTHERIQQFGADGRFPLESCNFHGAPRPLRSRGHQREWRGRAAICASQLELAGLHSSRLTDSSRADCLAQTPAVAGLLNGAATIAFNTYGASGAYPLTLSLTLTHPDGSTSIIATHLVVKLGVCKPGQQETGGAGFQHCGPLSSHCNCVHFCVASSRLPARLLQQQQRLAVLHGVRHERRSRPIRPQRWIVCLH